MMSSQCLVVSIEMLDMRWESGTRKQEHEKEKHK